MSGANGIRSREPGGQYVVTFSRWWTGCSNNNGNLTWGSLAMF